MIIRSLDLNAVAPDSKYEQSIQRAAKSKGGIVGQTRNIYIVVEMALAANISRDSAHFE